LASITFIAHNIFGVGGTVRTVLNLAEALSENHDVTIVSVYQRVDVPSFLIGPKIRIISIVDGRVGSSDRQADDYYRQSVGVHPEEELYSQYSLLTDARLREFFAIDESDVLIGTRPSLNLLVAEYGRDKALKIAQEHMSFDQISANLFHVIKDQYKKIDAVVTVTEHEARIFKESLGRNPNLVRSIPNSVTTTTIPCADQRKKLILAAGRITNGKRFELLIHAFHDLVDEFPDWKVRIYGDGPMRPSLRYLVQRLGLSNSVLFMGRTPSMDEEWIKGSVAVSTSDFESFGMTIIEAMNAGLAIVSTDCPVGPREIIRHGEDGLLVEPGDVAALSSALRLMMSNPAERMRVAQNGLNTAKKYAPEKIALQYETLIEELKPNILQPSSTILNKPRIFPSLPCLEGISANWLDGAGIEIKVQLSRPLPVGHLSIRMASKTGKARDFSVNFKAADKSRSQWKTILSQDHFNTDAIWDSRLSWFGLTLEQNNVTVDNRALVDFEPSVDQSYFAHIVPFKSAAGALRIRSWRRRRHVEVVSLYQNESTLEILTRPLFEHEDSCSAFLRRRGESDKEVACSLSPQGESLRIEVLVSSIIEERLEMHEDWDLYLRDSRGSVRVGYLLNDIVSKKNIINYPAWNIDETFDDNDQHREKIIVRPYMSIRNDLSISVVSKMVHH